MGIFAQLGGAGGGGVPAELVNKVTNSLSTGILTGGDLSVNGGDNTTFDVVAGTGYVVDNYTDADNPTITTVSFGPFTAESVTGLATDPVTFVGIDSAGAIVQQVTQFTQEQLRDIIALGFLVHIDNLVLTSASTITQFVPDSYVQLTDMANSLGVINREGNVFSANGANLNIDKSSGESFRIGANYVVTPKNPNIVTDSSQTALTFIYIYQDGSGGTTSVPSSTLIDPDQYDNGSGTLASVPNNRFTIQHITFFTNSDIVTVEYGQNLYMSLDDALINFDNEEFVTLLDTANSSFRCWLIVEEGVTDLTVDASVRFISAGKFGDSSGSGGAAAQNLQDTYDNSPDGAIVLDGTRDAFKIKDNSTPIAADLFEVTDNAGTTEYFKVDVNGSQTSQISFDGGTNYLDEYEEGTFTPELSGSTAPPDSITYGSQVGIYTRIGNRIDIKIFLSISTMTLGAGSGSAIFTELPFTSASDSVNNVGSVNFANVGLTGIHISSTVIQNATNVRFTKSASGSGLTNVNLSDFSSGDNVSLTLTYWI